MCDSPLPTPFPPAVRWNLDLKDRLLPNQGCGQAKANVVITLHGRRGAGKTTAAIELIIGLLNSGQRVRYVSHSREAEQAIRDIIRSQLTDSSVAFSKEAMSLEILYEIRDEH